MSLTLLALSDAGLVAIILPLAAALLGWIGTRTSDNSKLADSFIGRLQADNKWLREDQEVWRKRLDDLEDENLDLRKHVDQCDQDNAAIRRENALIRQEAEQLRHRVASLEAVLRRLLGEDAEGLDGL